MLKGTMEIVLRDAKTGKVQKRIKEHNLVTNAVSKIVNFGLNHSYATAQTQCQACSTNLYTTHLNLFRSIALFDTEITENANNIWLPAGVKPVAYGAVGTYGDDYPMMGSYSSSSEEYVEGESIKRVWTYDENHGNGTIACACLINSSAGLYGFGGADDDLLPILTANAYGAISCGNIITQTKEGLTSFGQLNRYIPLNSGVGDFAIDSDTDTKYQFRVNTTKLEIITHKMSPVNFDVFNGIHIVTPATIEEYNATFSGGSNVFWFYNTDEQILYFWLSDATETLARNATVTIHKFDVVNKVLTANWKTFTNDGNAPCYLNFAVTDTVVYTGSYGRYPSSERDTIRKYTFAGASSVQIGTANLNEVPVCKPYILNGVIYWNRLSLVYSNSSVIRTAIIDTSDDKIRYTANYFFPTYSTTYGDWVAPFANTQTVLGLHLGAGVKTSNMLSLENESGLAMGGNCVVPVNYLATINNLSSPVTKTASQTMTVSYTLSKAEE